MRNLLIWTAAIMLLAGCAARLSNDEAQRRAEEVFRGSFTKGNQKMAAAVFQQDEVQTLCTRYRDAPPREIAERIEKSQAATIVYPPSDKLMGDWREGEKIAQDGWGMRFTDNDPKRPNGGACYNCHRIGPDELSFGTVGPSLYRYARQRGMNEATLRYTYGKIYNAEAFAACSAMPRFGHNKVLTPEQITHLVALLLDPGSPVNK